jgi:copper(I)-binding protein
MQLLSILALSIALAFSTTASAHSFTVGDLRIGHPFARTTVPGQASGAVYLTLENTGKNTDKLVAVSTPIARTAELHSMSMDGNVMKMREVRNMEIKPAAKLAIMPGDGYHIMLTGLKQPLKAGDKFPLTLTFEKAGKLDVSVVVEDKEAKAAPEAGAPHKH